MTARWAGLRAQLESADPEVRSASAVAIGELWKEDHDAAPAVEKLLAELAHCDAAHPGIADAFFTAVAYELDEPERVKAWALQVLAARAASTEALSPVPGNNLEFYAHEWFDESAEALNRLLDWGYQDLVGLALDHRKLLPKEERALLERLCEECGRAEYARALAICHGVIRPELSPAGVEVDVDDVPAFMLTQAYGHRSQWTAQWVFFRGEPFVPPRAREDGAMILSRLRACALLPGDLEAKLNRKDVGHIPFPVIADTTRRSFTPRPDIALDVAVRAGTNEVVVIRIVRARRGSAVVHEIGVKP